MPGQTVNGTAPVTHNVNDLQVGAARPNEVLVGKGQGEVGGQPKVHEARGRARAGAEELVVGSQDESVRKNAGNCL